MQPILAAEKLTKHYGDLVAVDGIDFEITPGECFGFLGPNGAGKTTTVKMIHATVPLTSGTLEVFGKDITKYPREIKAKIGVCPQDINLDQDFSVLKNLIVFARYFGIGAAEARRRAETLIEMFQLADRRNQKIEVLSGGLKKRLLVVRALVNEPRLLILDEPTAGLDPQARHQIWDKIRELRKSGTTIILTTHYMEEAAVLCDRLMIMDGGKIIERGEPAELIDRHLGRDVIEIEDAPEGTVERFCREGMPCEEHAGRLYIYTDDGRGLLPRVTRELPSGSVVLRQASLEDVFLKLTGRQLRE
ncbi:MAG TPA: ATP-binding cassette domain-containing protein [Patescibacteria group bacterium]|nr:ATP-binding cassette domain-containing protein [Patescibacteria group bacterium]